jgi:hypothetical protein
VRFPSVEALIRLERKNGGWRGLLRTEGFVTRRLNLRMVEPKIGSLTGAGFHGFVIMKVQTLGRGDCPWAIGWLAA